VSPGTWDAMEYPDAMGYPARSGRLMWGRSPYTILVRVLGLPTTSPEAPKLVKGA
jgi:hypothetical protein